MAETSHNRNGSTNRKPENQQTQQQTGQNRNRNRNRNQNRNRNRHRNEKRTQIKIKIRNSKWNHIMTIAKRSDNAKCEIKFAFAARPLPLNISTSNDRNGAPQTRCSCNKILHTCSGNLPLINLCTYFVASRRGETGVQQGVYVLPGRAKPECSASF